MPEWEGGWGRASHTDIQWSMPSVAPVGLRAALRLSNLAINLVCLTDDRMDRQHNHVLAMRGRNTYLQICKCVTYAEYNGHTVLNQR